MILAYAPVGVPTQTLFHALLAGGKQFGDEMIII
jgi:hypothetical protein